MEESKVINNDNINNTDMSLLQSTGMLTPVLLILGDGTVTPPVEEEPVLLEEDEETTYKAVINSEYESKIPTITFESNASSQCDVNYVIAVTELDKNMPVSYDSQNLSTSFTNDGNAWCSVEFKNPLNVTFQGNYNLTSANFPDNYKIIVPVISCKENTGSERNTTITFNIKNFVISHNIQINVIQKENIVVSDNELEPNITNTSLLNKESISLLSNYVKINDCPQNFRLTKHNSVFTYFTDLTVQKVQSVNNGYIYTYSMTFGNIPLKGEKTNVYIGFQDQDMSFANNLDSNITSNDNTQLTSNTSGCTARFVRVPDDTTGAHIQFKLNKCTADRTISFSYKNSSIFSINQIYDTSGNSWTIYVCLVNISDYPNNNGFALFDNYTMSSTTDGNVLLQISPNPPGQTIYAVMYTPDGKIIMDNSRDTIGTLLKNGNLRHLSGHDYLTNDEYKDLYLVNISDVNHYENGTVSRKAVILDMDIYVYIKQQDKFNYNSSKTFNFKNTESNNHLGVYKLSETT